MNPAVKPIPTLLDVTDQLIHAFQRREELAGSMLKLIDTLVHSELDDRATALMLFRGVEGIIIDTGGSIPFHPGIWRELANACLLDCFTFVLFDLGNTGLSTSLKDSFQVLADEIVGLISDELEDSTAVLQQLALLFIARADECQIRRRGQRPSS